MSSPVWHPFTQHGLAEPIPRIVRARGALLECADGSKLIDGISSWWVTTHGHCHPRIAAAIAEQCATLDQLIFAGYTHEAAERTAGLLVKICPQPLTRVFFSDSGSTSVEVAVKMALGYWHGRGEPRHRIITVEHGYHGDTFGGMSLGHRGVFNARYDPLLFAVSTIPFPDDGNEQAAIDALDQACRAEPRPAAFLAEPLIAGAGGMRIYSAKVFRALAEVCRRHGVLWIADEVMTGWGRTGTLFAVDQIGMAPDLMCLAKGLTGGSVPLAATLATEEIFAAHLSTDRADMFYHSSSYTANPVACAAAAANIEIWEQEDVHGRIAMLAQRLSRRLEPLKAHPAFENVRQIGTIAALDLKHAQSGYLSSAAIGARDFFLQRGLLLRPLGNVFYVMPPYCTSDAQLKALLDGIGAWGDRCSGEILMGAQIQGASSPRQR